ncbi:MAG: hypothetical protein E7473_10890 [Ruminococcaceae bacterium]|nr:hypothetical protein [Oscillospiraceae bacterium]MBQ7119113.1 hypothetical protein [Oscillospiraceae bacterium]
MKKITICLIAMMLVLCGCSKKASENAGDTPAENMKPDDSVVKAYDKDGLSFDIPESWRQNFKAVTTQVGSGEGAYPQTDFYYTKDNRDVLMMSVGKYTREQWEKLKGTGEEVKDMLLGESEDKKHVYSIRYENHDYIDAKDEIKETIDGIKKEAEKLRDKIKIK